MYFKICRVCKNSLKGDKVSNKQRNSGKISRTADLTTGSPGITLIKFSLPMLLSSAFQQIYNIADSAIAGQFAGEDALAAIGVSYPVVMIFFAIASGFSIGGSVVIAQLFGAKAHDSLKTAINTAITAAACMGVFFTILGLTLAQSVLTLLGTPSNIHNESVLYLNIYFFGLLFLFIYNICTGIFTALGDSKTPLYFLILSSVGNIALDLLFVGAFGWGVAGAAWATFIAQGIASAGVFFVLLKRLSRLLDYEKGKVFSWLMFGKIIKIALPSILQQSFVSVGNLFLQTIINSFGSAVIAGYSAAIKLNTFSISLITTVSNAMSSYTGQNIGAGNLKRVTAAYRFGLLTAWMFSLPFVIAYFFFAPQMTSLFVNSQESLTAITTGADFLRIISPFYLVIAIKIVFDGVLRGSGAMLMFMISTFSDLLVRVVLSFILADSYGVKGLGYSWVAGWVVATVLSAVFFLSGRWKPKSLLNKPLETSA